MSVDGVFFGLKTVLLPRLLVLFIIDLFNLTASTDFLSSIFFCLNRTGDESKELFSVASFERTGESIGLTGQD